MADVVPIRSEAEVYITRVPGRREHERGDRMSEPGIEPEEPTHMLTIEVPLRLVGPLSSVTVKDVITAVLSIARVSGNVTDNPQVTLAVLDDA